MSSAINVLESLNERDRRVLWEQRRAMVWKITEWLVTMIAVATIASAIGFTYGIDYGKAQAEKRAAQAPKQGFSCKVAKGIANGPICRGM